LRLVKKQALHDFVSRITEIGQSQPKSRKIKNSVTKRQSEKRQRNLKLLLGWTFFVTES
jgi:hypothetical protein